MQPPTESMTQWNKIVMKHKECLFKEVLCEIAGKINHRPILQFFEIVAYFSESQTVSIYRPYLAV